MLYYASKISDNMAKTPEGFLLCQNVPIARIGKQEYMASELPVETSDPGEIVTVYRDPQDVFSKSAMASFEGKPVTNEHPSDMVNPQNVEGVGKGHAQNIRQVGDFLVADLFINDALLIAEIENGKREVSCGYNAAYDMRDGKLYQINIEGNHIAVVDSGRAGEKVSIKDSNPTKTERRVKMSKAKNKGLAGALANIWPHFNKDAQPGELAEVVEDLVETIKEEVKEETALEDKNCDVPAFLKKDEGQTYSGEYEKMYALLEGFTKKHSELLEDVYKKIEALESVYKTDKDPLEKLEAELVEELTEDGYEEEEVIADPEAINEQSDDEYAIIEVEEVLDKAGPVMPAYGKPKNPLDKEAALKEVKKMKPIVAGIKDAKQRKMMADSMARMIRASYGLPSPQRKQGGGYSGIISAQRSNAKAHQDSQRKKAPDYNEISQRLEKERLGKK